MTETETKDTGITLEFDAAPEAPQAPAAAAGGTDVSAEDMTKEAQLTPEEQKQVDAFAEKIDITNISAVMNY